MSLTLISVVVMIIVPQFWISAPAILTSLRIDPVTIVARLTRVTRMNVVTLLVVTLLVVPRVKVVALLIGARSMLTVTFSRTTTVFRILALKRRNNNHQKKFKRRPLEKKK
jgi:hypothetical protein